MKGRGVTVAMLLVEMGTGEDTGLRGARVQWDWKFSAADIDLKIRGWWGWWG